MDTNGEIKRGRGRPRLLRGDDSSSTAIHENEDNEQSKNEKYSWMLPYHGKSEIEKGNKYFFVNGRKLIMVYHDGKNICRRHYRTLKDNNKQDKIYRELLRKKEIPGA